MFKLWMLLLCCVFSAGLTGCGGESQTPAVPTEVPSTKQTETTTTDSVQDTAIDWNSLSYSYSAAGNPNSITGQYLK